MTYLSNIANSLNNMYYLDELASKKTWIHEIHPLAKLLVTIVYLIVVVSFDKFVISALLPLVFYPILLCTLGELPIKPLLKKVLVAAPFVIGVGIFNPILDKSVIMVAFGWPISAGWISFISLLIKCALTVLAALILLATTGMQRIAFSLRMLWIPKIFVLQLLLTYRYIHVLLEEASRVLNAYVLRAPGQKGIHYKAWGSLAGQMLLRTLDRAQRVYQAMVLRGFAGEYHPGVINQLSVRDFLYILTWSAFFLAARFYNIPDFIGRFVTGGL